MENQQQPTKKFALNYGLYLGLALILLGVILYAMGKTYDRDWYTQVLSIIITGTFIYLGIKEFKKSNNGILSLSQGLKTGVGIALISAVIYVLYTVIFVQFIEPDFIENITEMQKQQFLENPNMTDEMIEQMGENTRKYFWAFTIGGILIFSIFIGFVISLIASLIMKKTDEEITSI
ncbi:MAG: DUF4199 domain-containing protein [Flavobacteriaceae bacterium]|nr:DUF4199 domain-containing protein [Flavobacteriaceae bacterium]